MINDENLSQVLPQFQVISSDIDPTDMSLYYVMGEYYPPSNIDTLNIFWQGGRVTLTDYNADEYFVEEAATRQLTENERLSYVLDGSTFSVYCTTDNVNIDDAYKKLEIRIPKGIAENLKTVNIVNSGEVVLKDLKAESITVNGNVGSVKCFSVYADSLGISTGSGDVSYCVDGSEAFGFFYETKTGVFSDSTNGVQKGKFDYNCSIVTQSGNISVEYYSE
ncbi:MAG: DUF4097 family beta strand repeat-containing protein [Lachnospiraceae bacterium]|nr:DUF4097 family beta strand repeat-containing protein [Lachnospiraceae bacterium]